MRGDMMHDECCDEEKKDISTIFPLTDQVLLEKSYSFMANRCELEPAKL